MKRGHKIIILSFLTWNGIATVPMYFIGQPANQLGFWSVAELINIVGSWVFNRVLLLAEHFKIL